MVQFGIFLTFYDGVTLNYNGVIPKGVSESAFAPAGEQP